MKLTKLFALAVVVAISIMNLRAQSPLPEEPKTADAMVRAMKAANAEILKQQEKTIETLDALQKDAEQLKIFGKRS